MGNANPKDSRKNRNSNASVLDESLDSLNSLKEVNSPNIDLDFKHEIKDTIDLPIENEKEESEEINLDDKAEEIKNFIFLDGEAPPVSGPFPHQFRSKSYVPNQNISLFKAPKPQIKIFDEQISPFKLSSKCLGGSQWKNKMPSNIVLDFQKNLMENKSCNDNISIDDYFNDDEIGSDIFTERSTPNIEDFQNLQNCRKKMAIFRDSIDTKSELSLDENDKIDYIFSENKDKINKTSKIFIKCIKQKKQEFKSSNLRLSHINDLKKANTLKPQKIEENGLFLLGVLESASQEKKMKKKMRYTSNV
jgi:hypothetical protein